MTHEMMVDEPSPRDVAPIVIEKIQDDMAIDFAQSMRKEMVTQLMQTGLPVDNNDRNTILRALEGMTSTALSNKRLKTDKEISSEQAKAKAILGEVFKMVGNKNPFVAENTQDRKLEIPDRLVDDFTPVPGEMDIGVSPENFESFADKYGLKS